ncbi:membrane cofactor protein-like isoform X1 [Larimichthys crocea]|uniref:membrane cofactor protein-like isoform X1 n=1 Tax=Larimichthys crocea TaxID=215358 RepID=UPI000900BA7B|nr:membrane cofactor protein-like isoform X1 [Larimichthys crocea]
MGVTSFLLVSCLVISAQAQDCSKPASGPNTSLRDQYILLDSFSDGTRVSFKCNVGYTPAGGSPYITCTAGSWSHLTLICERKSCGPLEEKPNTLYDYSEGIEFGDKVVITCATGHVMPGAEQKKELLCGDQGWMGRQPVCEAVTCDPPPSIVDGSYNPISEHYSYRDVVQYSCQSNLVLNGSQSRACSEDGTFKPAAPKCVNVECKDPVIPNGEWVDGSRPPHKYQSSMTYRCKKGYTMQGSPNLMCGINNQWLPGIPQCKQLPTTTTTTTTTITPKGDGSSTKPWVIAVGVLVGIAVVVLIIVCIRKKRGTHIAVKEVANEEGAELSGKRDNPVASMLS